MALTAFSVNVIPISVSITTNYKLQYNVKNKNSEQHKYVTQ